MSIASQYLRGKGLVVKHPPEYSGVYGMVGYTLSPSISESVSVSTTPTATEAISESVTVTAT